MIIGFRLSTFEKMIAAVKRHDWISASDEMEDSLWCKQVGRRCYELAYMMQSAKTTQILQFNMEKFKDDLKRHEGEVLHIFYGDPIRNGHGAAMCGVGHLLKPEDYKHYGKPVGTPITKWDMLDYLNSDALFALQESRRMFGASNFNQYPEKVQLVLANMMFNLGYNR